MTKETLLCKFNLSTIRSFYARDRGSMRPKTSRLSRSSISNRLRPMSHMSRTIHPARSLSRLDSRPVTSRMSRSSSVTQWTQQRMRRCRAEQLILGQLAEMKRHQIRVGRFSEAVSVKRIAENYNKVRWKVQILRDWEQVFANIDFSTQFKALT